MRIYCYIKITPLAALFVNTCLDPNHKVGSRTSAKFVKKPCKFHGFIFDLKRFTVVDLLEYLKFKQLIGSNDKKEIECLLLFCVGCCLSLFFFALISWGNSFCYCWEYTVIPMTCFLLASGFGYKTCHIVIIIKKQGTGLTWHRPSIQRKISFWSVLSMCFFV